MIRAIEVFPGHISQVQAIFFCVIKQNHHMSPKALNRLLFGVFGLGPPLCHKQLCFFLMPTKCLE